MEATGGRSSGVEQTLAAPATEIPSDADAAFEALYRSSRDDVYAYVAELRRRRRHAELAAEPADDAAAPDAAAEVGVRRAALRGALARLSPRERELVALKFFAGLGNAEIAAVLGVSETNAGTRLHRTIQKLRRACDEAA